MKKKGIFAASFIGVASVWLGGHFGPGFATGAFSAQYYEKYGWIGLVMPLLAMLITGGVMFYMVEFARSKGTTNYRSFVQSAFGSEAFGKVMVVFYDILFIGTVIGAGGLAVAGEANILGKVYQISFWGAAIPTIIVAALLCLYGSKLVARSSKYMMYAIVVIVLLIFVLSCASGKPDYAAAFKAPPIEQNNTLLNAIWKAILYGCFQSTIAFNVMSVSDLLESRAETKKAIIVGYIVTVILMIAIAATLFGYIPSNPDIINLGKTPVPMMAVIMGLQKPWLTIIFVILMTFAVLTSAAGIANAGCVRFDRLFSGIKNVQLRRAIITAILLGIAAFGAWLDMEKLTKTVTTYIGYAGILGLVIPAFTIVRSKLKKEQ
ncbi:MAG: amino acid permease [Oscillospiraceae bacterium]|nr:amino acid permease [Oscillospiraceae bacterium]